MVSRKDSLEANLRRYSVYIALRETYFWLPVFFLYFSQRLALADVLTLEAVYYAAVVALEVPSGYASDRFGRKVTLVLSSAFLLAAYGLFVASPPFGGLLLAQVLLAAGLAFASGTDTSFLYDTLAGLGRQGEYGEREARLARVGAWAMAVGALGGGAIGLVDLRWAYGLSALGAVGTLVATLAMVEPPHAERAAPPLAQLRACLSHVGTGPLGWLFAFAALAVVLNHVPYEFYQGYLALTLDDLVGVTPELSPLAAGVHTTAAALLAGWAAGWSVQAAQRLGTRRLLLASAALQLLIVTAMGLLLHPLIAALLLLRGLPGGVQRAPMREAIAPRVPSSLRATYLSLQSLAGRLAYAVVLAVLAFGHGAEGALGWEPLSARLLRAALIGAVLLAPLLLWRPRLEPPAAASVDTAGPRPGQHHPPHEG